MNHGVLASRRARVTAVLAVAAALTDCQLFSRFTDCHTDDDCRNGQVCSPVRHFCHAPTPEVCGNGVDDDLDGLNDADDDYGACEVPGWTGPAMGCRDGVRRCMAGQLQCVQRAAAGEETCSNGIDDECNGVVDDSARCVQNFNAVTSAAPMTIGSNDPSAFGEGDDAPAHQVCLAAFQLDRYEVSFAAYLRFLNSIDAARVRLDHPTPLNPTVPPQQYLLIDDQPAVQVPDAPDDLAIEASPTGYRVHNRAAATLPMVRVTWLGADAYCRWAGKHLPSEAEWWRATRDASGTRTYPWGETAVDCTLANVGTGGPSGGPCVCNVPGASAADGGMDAGCPGAPIAVDSLPNGRDPEGVFNLYGNVSEWMWDFLDDDMTHTHNHYYESLPPDGWCLRFPQGPLGPTAGTTIARPGDAGLYCVNCRFARGRHFQTTDLRPGIRRWLDADRTDATVGFRCSAGGAAR